MDIFTKTNDIVKVFSNIEEDRLCDGRIKISIIGCGSIGGACGAALIYTHLQAHIVLIEPIPEYFGREKSLYNSLDHSRYKSVFYLSYSTDIIASANSDICILCFEKEGKTINSFNDNISNLIKYLPKIVKLSPKVILFALTFPYSSSYRAVITHKIAKIPKNRIIGVGTSLATKEFQIIIAKKFNISPKEVGGYVIGLNNFGHKIPVWSSVSVCGIQLNTILPNLETDDDPLQLHREFMKSEFIRENIHLQFGQPRWTVSLLCAKICHAIAFNTKEIFTIPINLKGIYNTKKTCYISLPCTVGRNGIHSILKLHLHLKEMEYLTKAVATSITLSKDFQNKSKDLEDFTDFQI